MKSVIWKKGFGEGERERETNQSNLLLEGWFNFQKNTLTEKIRIVVVVVVVAEGRKRSDETKVRVVKTDLIFLADDWKTDKKGEK